MQKTKVGIVGMGFIGHAHLDALRRLPFVDVVALCDSDAGKTRALAEKLNIPQWYTDPAELTEAVDAVHNCTPNRFHDAVNRLAIARGRHIYSEKPLSNTLDDARATLRAAEMAGVLHGLNHQYRMNPAVQEMRARVRSGSAGRVFLAGGRYHQQSGLYSTDYGWRMTEGGMSCALSDIGTHWVDTARCVLGREITRVMANVQTIHPIRTKPDGQPIDVQTDDLSSVLMEFEGGIQGMMTVSKVAAGHMNDLVFTVDAQQCSMEWAQQDPNRLLLGYKGAPNQVLMVSPQLMDPEVSGLVTLPGGHPMGFGDALMLALRDFYAAVRGEIAASAMRCATFADGVAGMAFVEAAVKSSRTRQWVAVEK